MSTEQSLFDSIDTTENDKNEHTKDQRHSERKKQNDSINSDGSHASKRELNSRPNLSHSSKAMSDHVSKKLPSVPSVSNISSDLIKSSSSAMQSAIAKINPMDLKNQKIVSVIKKMITKGINH